MYGAVCLQPVYPPDQFVSMVRHVEDLGLGDLWLTDSSLHSRYCYSYLTLAAVNTSRVRLGTAVTNPVTRHPAMAAVGAATLDEISGGRAVFGIGAGDRPLDALGLKPARLGLLEDAILAARRLWSGEHVDMQARGFTLADAHLRFPARPDIPVYISASGPMTLELAGRIADGVILLAGLHPDGLSYALEHIDRGVDQAGRGARPKITVFAYGAIDEDEEVALAAGRTIAAWFPMTAPVYCELAGLSPELVAQVRAAYSGGEFQEAAAAAELLPDDFVRRMSLSGNRAATREHIRTLDKLGIDSMAVFPLGGDATSRVATITAFAECLREEGHLPA
ncbi:methylenetetrahydromethanopterin reductase [Pseudonocardia thermophila]|mgnify:CR=1 FL=1|jgi:Coenzyme F420-dependent N5,N10-methylene tetrahydromethanopterin reductase and related flavin-dependent oxidoreductases|uniref:Methylenetetrahydromethanopterin reductase n=1 Tax=Pseudonocardia thermophila TaxID=1848 RepID=A0A1M6P6J8_PSETH|nr:LLM class flavin-dependent oxidoreductase [Pseudonocardia thermophila]SHK03545.1 methylenetetrahydromethanopterin reductase [Pseudonocardia thermophila]